MDILANKSRSILAGLIFLLTICSNSVNADLVEKRLTPILYQKFAMNTFVYNPRSLQWQAISANGNVIRTGPGSGGQHYCADIKRSCRTPSGSFRIISKGPAACRSSRYPVGKGGAPMPYCMFFSKYYAVHGSYDVPKRNASHGCVRVLPEDAKWLSQNFMQIGTHVVIKPY